MKISLAVIIWMMFQHALLGFHIEIDVRWHDKPVPIPCRDLVTPSGERFDLTRLDFLLSEPQVILASGGTVTFPQWHAYFHGEKPMSVELPELSEAKISKLILHLGPAEEVNHGDPNQYSPEHALNPLYNNLHWSPQGGYIFLALEGYLPEEEVAFSYHYGNSENRLLLEFNEAMDSEGSYQLTLHLERLFEAPFRMSEQTSTHSRPDDPLVPYFKENLKKAFTLTPRSARVKRLEKVEAGQKNLVGTPYPFTMPKNFPYPNLPSDYPLTQERVRLGRELFFETALSKNTATSCASCHPAQSAFADPTARSFGFEGKPTKRHSMGLLNLAWKTTPFFWDGREPSLRSQILKPIEDPLEMGESLLTLPAKLAKISYYPVLFKEAFGDSEITAQRLAVAIEQFLLTLTSYDSRFDRARKGLAELTAEEKRGFQLFMTENDPRLGLRGADCFHCHSGAFFTNHRFHNNGLSPANGDLGLEHSTGKSADRYRFATPSLRNIALTSPYMHDGRFETLEEVLHFYSEGVHRSPTLDPNIAKHRGTGLQLSKDEQAALIAFLKTLNDPQFGTTQD